MSLISRQAVRRKLREIIESSNSQATQISRKALCKLVSQCEFRAEEIIAAAVFVHLKQKRLGHVSKVIKRTRRGRSSKFQQALPI